MRDIKALRLSGDRLSTMVPKWKSRRRKSHNELCLSQMLPKKESEKPPVIEHLFEQYEKGGLPDGLVTSDRIAEAIKATGADLGTANPANFLKDIV